MSSEVPKHILEAIMLVEVVDSLASKKGVPLSAVGAGKLDRPDSKVYINFLHVSSQEV